MILLHTIGNCTVEQLEKEIDQRENMATKSYWRKAENCNG
jgi:hypothetical protein